MLITATNKASSLALVIVVLFLELCCLNRLTGILLLVLVILLSRGY